RVSLGALRPTTTRFVPSGDHWTLVTPLRRFVTRRGSPPPSGSSHTWVRVVSPVASPCAGLADRNAIALPSGLHLGLFDDCGAVVSVVGSRDPSEGTDQIALRRRFCFWSMVVTTTAMVEPSGARRGSPSGPRA